ncbi:MAG TPA: ribosome maturation factor RimM [Actinomycetota bacterium]|nr:ribosome maturation factor RimM [Actinomycetota bacterium]
MLLAGEVGKPHGLAGDVYVVVISDDPHRFEPGSVLHSESAGELTIERCRRHSGRVLVKFERFDTREQAETLRGPLYVAADHARALDDDEYWHDDLVGLMVTSREGAELGRVEAVVAGPAQDLLEVATPAGARLVPIVKEIVVSVDVAAGTVVVDPPEGLFD